MTYKETLDYLYSRLPVFHHVGASAYKPGLDNTISLLSALGNPQRKFKSIHVAGTNGKGSVSHFLSAIFQSAGYKTGLYTSPHLVDFGERIRVNGQKIDPSHVVRFTEEHVRLFDVIQPSFFEATMAMAFNYFSDNEVDIVIVETGLGGRLDSTNIIQPVLSVITNISFDHMGFLGDTLEKIAFEKAGIIKKNIPVVIGEWADETHTVFEQKAAEMDSYLVYADENLNYVTTQAGKMVVKTKTGGELLSGLNGDYQLKNIATVLKSIEVFNQFTSEDFKPVDEYSVLEGIKNVVELTGLQGRWQQLHSNPLVIADTGHNTAGISYVVDQLSKQNYLVLRIVIGMVNDKDIHSVLELLPRNAVYYFTNADVQRALPAADLQLLAQEKGLKGKAFRSVKLAINAALNDANVDDLIFIGGSNFIVGEAIPLF